MRVSRIVSSTTWKRAVGEILLIVIGVTIALAVNSWYTERARNSEGMRYLELILSSLQTDRELLAAHVTQLEDDVRVLFGLRQHLRERRPYTEELDSKFGVMNLFRRADVNSAIYESLKARGLDLIPDDQLRLKVIELYEIVYTDIQDSNDILFDFATSYWTGPMLSRLEIGVLKGTPYDYEMLLDDREFNNLIGLRSIALDGFIIPSFEGQIQAVESLMRDIEVELASYR